jgi:hypothetical protein
VYPNGTLLSAPPDPKIYMIEDRPGTGYLTPRRSTPAATSRRAVDAVWPQPSEYEGRGLLASSARIGAFPDSLFDPTTTPITQDEVSGLFAAQGRVAAFENLLSADASKRISRRARTHTGPSPVSGRVTLIRLPPPRTRCPGRAALEHEARRGCGGGHTQ